MSLPDSVLEGAADLCRGGASAGCAGWNEAAGGVPLRRGDAAAEPCGRARTGRGSLTLAASARPNQCDFGPYIVLTRLRTSAACERVRAQVSLELDGELSQIERAMLRAHIRRCPDCSSFEHAARAFTGELRSAPLELPSHPMVVSRQGGRRVQLATQRIAQVGVAALLLVGGLGLANELRRADVQSPKPKPAITKNLFKIDWQPQEELALLVFQKARANRHSDILFDSI
jgi:hypothetical protein